MKFYPVIEFACSECGNGVWTTRNRLGDGKHDRVIIRCTNRGCVNHGKQFVVELIAHEGSEISLS